MHEDGPALGVGAQKREEGIHLWEQPWLGSQTLNEL